MLRVSNELLVTRFHNGILSASPLQHTLQHCSKPTVNLATLTKREIECLNLTVKGKPAKKVAYELRISQRTVEEHLTNIKKKMGVFSKAELIEKSLTLFTR